jgi:MFS family permease
MIELLERQKRLTKNQWKLICTANLADLLDFFDLFLIGYVTAALTKQWSLTYLQGGMILLASGIGAPPGAFFWGWLGDRIGRRTVFMWSAVTIALATGVMYFTPGQDGFIPGWLFLVIFRIFVGLGNAGIYTIDLPLVQEFIPAYKRGWVSALVTTLLPAGSLLAGLAAWQLLPIIGWRGLFLIGLVPLVLVFMIRYWVPESPRWLMRMGRLEEARKSLAWALMVDPKEIDLPPALPSIEETRWVELFKYPKLVMAGMLTGLTQTGGFADRGVGTDPAGAGARCFARVCRVPDDLRQRVGGSRPVFHHRPDRAARSPRLGDAVPGAWRNSDGVAGLLLQRLHRCLVGVLSGAHRVELFRQRQLLGGWPVHGGDLAGAIARQRDGFELRYRQSRQVHRPSRLVADHGGGRCHQAGRAEPRHAGPGVSLFCFVECGRPDRLLGIRSRTQGPHL